MLFLFPLIDHRGPRHAPPATAQDFALARVGHEGSGSAARDVRLLHFAMLGSHLGYSLIFPVECSRGRMQKCSVSSMVVSSGAVTVGVVMVLKAVWCDGSRVVRSVELEEAVSAFVVKNFPAVKTQQFDLCERRSSERCGLYNLFATLVATPTSDSWEDKTVTLWKPKTARAETDKVARDHRPSDADASARS